ncbi:hypothetical protein AZZ81_000091, partial [Klebsiella aerogenes]
PRWRLRLPGLPTEYRTVARRRRYAPSPGIHPANSRHFLLFRRPLYCGGLPY